MMGTNVIFGTYLAEAKKCYRSKCGRYYFNFKFVDQDGHVDLYCTDHPPLNGRDSDPRKTHLFPSGKICFVAGREPRSPGRAEEMAAQWAEYFLEYRRTGRTQD